MRCAGGVRATPATRGSSRSAKGAAACAAAGGIVPSTARERLRDPEGPDRRKVPTVVIGDRAPRPTAPTREVVSPTWPMSSPRERRGELCRAARVSATGRHLIVHPRTHDLPALAGRPQSLPRASTHRAGTLERRRAGSAVIGRRTRGSRTRGGRTRTAPMATSPLSSLLSPDSHEPHGSSDGRTPLFDLPTKTIAV